MYQNSTGLLPSAPGRIWFEADLGVNPAMSRAKPGYRLAWSNDGLACVTFNHYEAGAFYQQPNWM